MIVPISPETFGQACHEYFNADKLSAVMDAAVRRRQPVGRGELLLSMKQDLIFEKYHCYKSGSPPEIKLNGQ